MFKFEIGQIMTTKSVVEERQMAAKVGDATAAMVIRCAFCKQETSRPGQWIDPDTFACSVECKHGLFNQMGLAEGST